MDKDNNDEQSKPDISQDEDFNNSLEPDLNQDDAVFEEDVADEGFDDAMFEDDVFEDDAFDDDWDDFEGDEYDDMDGEGPTPKKSSKLFTYGIIGGAVLLVLVVFTTMMGGDDTAAPPAPVSQPAENKANPTALDTLYGREGPKSSVETVDEATGQIAKERASQGGILNDSEALESLNNVQDQYVFEDIPLEDEAAAVEVVPEQNTGPLTPLPDTTGGENTISEPAVDEPSEASEAPAQVAVVPRAEDVMKAPATTVDNSQPSRDNTAFEEDMIARLNDLAKQMQNMNVRLETLENDISDIRRTNNNNTEEIADRVERLSDRLDAQQSAINDQRERATATVSEEQSPAPRVNNAPQQTSNSNDQNASDARESLRNQRAEAVETQRARPQPQAVNWVLKSARPGEAIVSRDNSADSLTVKPGDNLSGIGTIRSISNESGTWVVQGTSGSITP